MQTDRKIRGGREEASGVMDVCFEDVLRTEQPERSNQKKDEPGGTTLFQRSVNQPFLQESGHLGREVGLRRKPITPSSSAATANTILFTK